MVSSHSLFANQAIRRVAKKGDWIIGFTPKSLGWKVAYVAFVDDKIDGRNYYSRPGPRRLDQIYKYSNGVSL